ncbi:MAG TPA: Tim44 domain-containing protein [Methylomirabilota bacterium]|jgi:predicted lipid-binding transport protein (Tim44 family)|nr:Tim44 domain-containing protein [Methylomirabilota bacterium]
MKRSVAIACLAIIALAPVLLVTDAWARAGGGSSGGSRGSRSYSSPARPSPTPATPSQPTSPPSSVQPQPQRSGWGAGLMGGLAGLALGGLLGSMLFGHGMGGGIGMLEILLIAGGAFLLFRMMRNRQAASQPSYGQAGGGTWQSQPQPQPYQAPVAQAQPVEIGPSDLDRGIANIRQMDAGFDPARLSDIASDIFFKVQAGWMNRDMREAAAVVTPEMSDILQKDCDRLRGQGRVNRLENIAVRSVDLSEAWQESGQDFVTVHFLANLLDYTVDERSGQVVEGNRSEPVKFEEFWTFVRPVGPNPWRLTAIQQA